MQGRRQVAVRSALCHCIPAAARCPPGLSAAFPSCALGRARAAPTPGKTWWPAAPPATPKRATRASSSWAGACASSPRQALGWRVAAGGRVEHPWGAEDVCTQPGRHWASAARGAQGRRSHVSPTPCPCLPAPAAGAVSSRAGLPAGHAGGQLKHRAAAARVAGACPCAWPLPTRAASVC